MAGMAVQSRVEDETLGTHLVDEFTAPGEQRRLLEQSRGRVQALFPVVFTVLGSLENLSDEDGKPEKNPRRIWLQIKGRTPAVVKAKEYVKGLCEPEMDIRESYPKEMHCIFASAHSLFLNRLITDTCAHIAMVDIGMLNIRGGTEPVVMAQSHVQQFVRLFKNHENLSHDREPEVKRRFKQFVEANADKYTMDLLILPSTLKEELLNLASEGNEDLEKATVSADSTDQGDGSRCREQSTTPVMELAKQLDSVFSSVPKTVPNPPLVPVTHQDRSSVKRRCSGSDEKTLKKPFSLDCIQVDGPITRVTNPSDVPIIDLVCESGDDSLITIEDDAAVSSETEYKILVNFFKTMGYSKEVVEKIIKKFGQSEEPLRLLEEIEKESNKTPSQCESKTCDPQIAKDVTVPKKESRPQQEVSVDPLSTHAAISGDLRKHKPPGTEGPKTQRQTTESDLLKTFSFAPRGASSPPRGASSPPRNRQVLDSGVWGPSNMPMAKVMKQITVGSCTPMYPPRPVQGNVRPSVLERPDKHKPSVTGVQVFLNSIKTPYKLELKNEPGRADLRHIIIDGSNVAISHGLHQFFSCRGIAIAVAYFWKLGHRKVTVFVPQWRTKRDPNITEQHFLHQLEELGILSFTPSRTVLGSRIAAHDDRFLLHLADRTEGVIVTNDNLREFVVESRKWTQIIKERLLQYTFAGDIFMIPDDPLGRHGPNLEAFLSQRPVQRDHHHPLASRPPDSGVFFPRQDSSLSGIFPAGTDHSHPRAFLPIDKRPAFSATLQNILRPQAVVPPQRTPQETVTLKEALLKIFPESQQREKIEQVLSAHPYMRDLNALSAMILD